MSKKEKRLHSKKRKAEAFLAIAKLNDAEKAKKVKLDSPPSSDGDDSSDKPDELSSKTQIPQVPPPSSDSWVDKLKESNALKDASVQEALKKARAEIKARQKKAMAKAKLFLTTDELKESLSWNSDNTDAVAPIFITDLQHLLSYALQAALARYRPRWCKLLRMGKLKRVVLIVVENINSTDYTKNKEIFQCIDEISFASVEMINPCQYGKNVIGEILDVPKSYTQMKREGHKTKTWSVVKQQMEMSRTVTPVVVNQSEHPVADTDDDSFSRCHLLMNAEQMCIERCPLPLDSDENSLSHYVYSQENYKPVSASSPMFAIDCEMCQCGNMKALTWVAVVNENLETVYETLVKPEKKITNYITQYSGVRKEMLENVTTSVSEVQETLRNILPPDAILCGQSFSNDLHALQMFHPYIIDTSIIYNLKGERKMKSGLRVLAKTFLNKDIQLGSGTTGHNPVEDSITTMQLVKMKLKNGFTFGDVILGGEMFPLSNKHGQENSAEASDVASDTSDSGQEDDDDTIAEKREAEAPAKSSQANVCPALQVKGNDQRLAFFARVSSGSMENFYDIINKSSKKTGTLIGPEALSARYEKTCARHITCTSDKSAVRALKSMAHTDFTLLQLNAYGDDDKSAEPSQDAMQKLSKKLTKCMKYAGEDCLLAITLAGRQDMETNRHGNVMCFVKIT